MKILLFGEFSGLFNCLRDGLVENGHEVFMVSNGDGVRNYPTDYNWWKPSYRKYGRFKHLFELKNLYFHKNLLRGYDVVMLIHPIIFSRFVPVIRPVFNYLIENNEKVFLSGAGLTPIGYRYWYNTNGKYRNYIEGEMKDMPSLKNNFDNKSRSQSLIDWEYELLDRINGYIPIWYEYAMPFKGHPHCLKTVRIPINYYKQNYKPNIVKDKIVFFASISPRKYSKGFPYIKEAFDRMEKKYGDVAEFVAAGGLPFNEYMDLISRTNVVMDDANSFSIAMNGLFSLAKGKIVMGGAEPVANAELGLEWNPVYNLCPDVDQICSCIEDVINKKDQIEEMGRNGRKFVEQYHDYKDIAKQYVELFEKY